jgi:hypothetical protein
MIEDGIKNVTVVSSHSCENHSGAVVSLNKWSTENYFQLLEPDIRQEECAYRRPGIVRFGE